MTIVCGILNTNPATFRKMAFETIPDRRKREKFLMLYDTFQFAREAGWT